jgi:hypothetical protein
VKKLLGFLKNILFIFLFFFVVSIPISITYTTSMLYAASFFSKNPVVSKWFAEILGGAMLISIGVFPFLLFFSSLILIFLKLIRRFNKKYVAWSAFLLAAFVGIISAPDLEYFINPFFYLIIFNGWMSGILFWTLWQSINSSDPSLR